MSQRVSIPYQACGHSGAVAHLGQSLTATELRWHRSISCPTCGRLEEDGQGLPPEAFRELLLKHGGWWRLALKGASTPAAMKVVRAALGLSLAETVAAFRSFPVVYVGTRTEARWLQTLMEEAGITSEVEESL